MGGGYREIRLGGMNPRVYNGTYTGLKNERFVRFLRFLAISVHIPVYRENLREEREWGGGGR